MNKLSTAAVVPFAPKVVILVVRMVPGGMLIGGYVGLDGFEMFNDDTGSVVRTLDTAFFVNVATASTPTSLDPLLYTSMMVHSWLTGT